MTRIAALVFLSFLHSAAALAENMRFEQLISDIPVFAIAMDKENILWLGTESGLARYNSKSFKYYHFDPRDSLSLLDNSIRSLLIDSRDNLWIGTRNGLNRYQPHDDNFARYIPDRQSPSRLHGNFITSLAEDTDGFIWVGSESDGLHRLNPVSGAIIHFKANDAVNSIISNNIETIQFDTRGDLWVASRHGISYRDKNINQWRHYYASSGIGGSLQDHDLIDLMVDNENNIWLSSRNGYLSTINTKDEIVNYELPHAITTMYKDMSGNLFFGTINGQLFMLSYESSDWKESVLIQSDATLMGAIRAIHRDFRGNIWVGSENGLYVHYNFDRPFFGVDGNTTELPMISVMAMMQDKDDKLWLSSGRSLIIQDRNHADEPYRLSDQQIPDVPNVYCIFQDSKGLVWLGTFENGLFRYDTGKGTLTQHKHQADNARSIGHNSIWAIAEDDAGHLWIGSWGGGLIYFNRENQSFKTFAHDPDNENSLAHNKILSLLIDRDGMIWIGTDGGGLNRYDPHTNSFKRFPVKLEGEVMALDRSILCLHEDRSGKIWMGSDGGGLISYDKVTDSFDVYNAGRGLLNQSVKMILEDSSGQLWLSTNGGGIFLFLAKEERFIQFTTNDGLSTNRFHNNAGLLDRNGLVFFGGCNGYTYFNPSLIEPNNYDPELIITDILINNENRTYGEEGLLQSISETGELKLKPTSQLIVIEFAAIEYSLSNTNNYRYRIRGFNEQWTDLEQNSRISLMNLPHGKYTFEIQASNADGLWSDETLSFMLTILPPFYKTPLFIAGFAVLSAVLLFFLYTYNMRGLRRRQLLLEAEVAQRTEKVLQQSVMLEEQNKILISQKQELTERNRKIIKSRERIRFMTLRVHEADQLKLRFFTNISHDLRTPLTLIIGPLEQLINKFMHSRDDTLDHLLTMRHNAGRILRLFDQITTFRKAESGALKLKAAHGDISAFVKSIIDTFSDYASNKNIDLLFMSNPEKAFIYFDDDKVEKIFMNLLSNALRYTASGGKVEVEVTEMPEMPTTYDSMRFPDGVVVLSVRDTGIGIPEKEIPHIFKRFYQVDQKKSDFTGDGVGIGLSLVKSLVDIHHGMIQVESAPGEGSCFRVLLPRGHRHLKHNEVVDTPVSSEISHPHELSRHLVIEELSTGHLDGKIDSTPCHIKNAPTVLIVEDNHELRNYLLHLLSNEYKMLEAENGLKALEVLEKSNADIIISDVVMPEMDGLSFLQRLKSDIEFCHIPVIMLSAKAAIEDKIAGLKLNADAYLAKPFHINHLTAVISTLLENRKLIQIKLRDTFFTQPEEIEVRSADEIFLQKAKAIIEENISNPDFDVNQLSRDVGVSRAGVYRKMKALTNMSVSILIRNMRMKRAAQILEQNKVNVSEVAYMVGFNDVQYFRKCFQKMYKMPPSQYAEKNISKGL